MGSHSDYGKGIAVDNSGAAYVTGHTNSTDFPTTPGAYDISYNGSVDAFVTKLSSAGNSLIYSTYLGGNDDDLGYGIAVDGSGAAYVTGCTSSTDFPTLNPYQTDQVGGDAFVTKLSSFGSLIYSTYLGGSYIDKGNDIAVDLSGAAYVTGETCSTDFPTFNPYQGTNQAYQDIFVTKLSSSGSSLIYSTYLGGNWNDNSSGIAVDGSGAAYVTGTTQSSDFPTFNPYQTDPDITLHDDAFVTKFSNSGDSLVYSTYLGGSSPDYGHDIAVSNSGAAYVTGYTKSTDFPTLNPYQGTHQGGYFDVFVTKIGDFPNAVDDDEAEGVVPNGFSLYQNYPNPFNPSTTIEFYLGRASHVELHILNVLGQEVRTIDLGRLSYGTHSTSWDGRDNSGQRLSSGMYFYRIKAGTSIDTKKMIMLK